MYNFYILIRTITKEILYAVVPKKYQRKVISLLLAIKLEILHFLFHGLKNIPNAIDFETYGYCNRRCWYCPRTKENDSCKLEWQTITRLIDELAKWGFKGRFSPHSFNEPLYDDRLMDIIRYARAKLTKATIVLFTNGDALSEDKLLKLVSAGVDNFIISIHEPTSTRQADFLINLHHKYTSIIQLQDFRTNFKKSRLNSRGGQVEIKHAQHVSRCPNAKTMVVRASGNIVLCCHDARETTILGSVYKTLNYETPSPPKNSQ